MPRPHKEGRNLDQPGLRSDMQKNKNNHEEFPSYSPVPFSSRFDLFWPRFREVLAFGGGFGIMVFEAVGDLSDRPWLYAAAIGMMGLPIARYAEGTLTKFGSNKMGPTEPPPEEPPPDPPRKRTRVR